MYECNCMTYTSTATSKVENSAQVSSFWLKFVYGQGYSSVIKRPNKLEQLSLASHSCIIPFTRMTRSLPQRGANESPCSPCFETFFFVTSEEAKYVRAFTLGKFFCQLIHLHIRLKPTQVEHHMRASLQGRFLVLPANIRPEGLGLPGPNALANFFSSSVTDKKVL